MKTQGKVWIVYNSQNKSQTKPLSVVQAQAVLLSIPRDESIHYFLWTPGWEKWESVKDFLKSEQNYFVIAQPPRPEEGPFPQEETVTKTKTGFSRHTQSGVDSAYTQVVIGDGPLKEEIKSEFYSQDFSGDELDISKIRKVKPPKSFKMSDPKPDGRRLNPRHNFKIEILIISKMNTFRTYSKNISLSGTMLEDEVPKDYLKNHFELVIINPLETNPAQSRLLFKAKIVGDLTDSRRLMFIEQDETMTQRLDAMLKAYIAYQQHLKETAS